MKQRATILVTAAVAVFTLATSAGENSTKPSFLYGTVVSVNTASSKIVIAPKDGPQVTVTTDVNTRIQWNNGTRTLGDVKPDMILRISPATGTAKEIVADTSFQPMLYGSVVSVDTTSGKVMIMLMKGSEQVTIRPTPEEEQNILYDPDRKRPVPVSTDRSTKVMVDNKAATLADVKPEMLIMVRPVTGPAKEIIAFTPPPPTVEGRVVSVDAVKNKILVLAGNALMTVATDGKTQLRVLSNPGTLADVKPGMFIRVSPASGPAKEMLAMPVLVPPAKSVLPLVGTVFRVDAASSRIVVTIDGRQVSVATDGDTGFKVNDKDGTLADVKPGMRIEIKSGVGTAIDITACVPEPPTQ